MIWKILSIILNCLGFIICLGELLFDWVSDGFLDRLIAFILMLWFAISILYLFGVLK